MTDIKDLLKEFIESVYNQLNILSKNNSTNEEKSKALYEIYSRNELKKDPLHYYNNDIEANFNGFFTELLLEQYPNLIESIVDIPENMFCPKIDKIDEADYIFTMPNSPALESNTSFNLEYCDDEILDRIPYVNFGIDKDKFPTKVIWEDELPYDLRRDELIELINTPGVIRFVNGMIYELRL